MTFAGNFALNSANPPHRLLRTLKMSSHTTHPGTVHRISLPSDEEFAPLVVAFEHGQPSHDPVQNTLIFLGGLFDGLLTVPYVPPVVKSLPLSWSLVEPILKSAYKQFGIASLGEDIAEIATLVEHFRSLRPGKIVLLGHSTGSQQIIHYLLSPSSPKIDGAIMQGSASDREAMMKELSLSDYEATCALAQSYVDEDRSEDILPFAATRAIYLSVPISAKRWLSMASPGPAHVGEDDYFSSDLDDERMQSTFGALGEKGTKVAFLYSDNDQFVPDTVNKKKLLERWHEHTRRGGGMIDEGSGIVQGASHTLNNGVGLEDLVTRITGFLQRI